MTLFQSAGEVSFENTEWCFSRIFNNDEKIISKQRLSACHRGLCPIRSQP